MFVGRFQLLKLLGLLGAVLMLAGGDLVCHPGVQLTERVLRATVEAVHLLSHLLHKSLSQILQRIESRRVSMQVCFSSDGNLSGDEHVVRE